MITEKIIQFTPDLINEFFNFREKVENEGGTALDRKKIDPLNFQGAIFFHYFNNEIGSICAIERSVKYTEEYNVARICRFYILKKYRHNNSGFKMIPYMINWAKNNNIELIYWTHDKSNRALNSLYQHKRIRKTTEKKYFLSENFLNFVLLPEYTFKTGSKSVEQYVYAYKLNKNFEWNPKGLIYKNYE